MEAPGRGVPYRGHVPSDDKDELQRQFDAAISGMELADLRRLGNDVAMLTGRPRSADRPDLRRSAREDLAILRVRVDLDHAEPPIWRRLDLRADLSLDVVHRVLQVAFGWTDSHLHRFALGGGPFDQDSQLFLCPFDVEEGEDDGAPASDVRLDETLQDPGDELRYVYDYGDSWELTLRLEEVLPAALDAPSALVVDGDRAAPPEDSGGMTDAESLAEVLDDPAHFDVAETNEALRDPYFVLRELGIDHRLVDLMNRLRHSSIGEELASRVIDLVMADDEPTPEEKHRALHAVRWFLDRAGDGGIVLTSAGYLRPADVEEASRVVPGMAGWWGKKNRESHTGPLLDFRMSLQSFGLLRKYKGKLVLTRLGAAAQQDPSRLWDLLARQLGATHDGFDTEATLLLLAYAASSDGELPLEQLAEALTHLGWRDRDGGPLEHYHLYRMPALDLLTNIAEESSDPRNRHRISPAAAALARTALRQGS